MTQNNSNLEAYKTYIKNLADNPTNEIFLNSSFLHASTVISNILRTAKKEVLVFAGDLNNEVTKQSEYLNSLLTFLSNNGKLKIILNEYNPEKPPVIFYLMDDEKYKEQIEVRKIVNMPLDELFNGETPFHFTVGDDSMFRFEHDIESYFAFGSFNRPDIVSRLKLKFNKFWEKAEVLDLSLI